MLRELKELETSGLKELKGASGVEALERWRIDYLGAKGKLKAIMPQMKDVPAAQKPEVGKRLNEVKESLERAFAERKQALAAAAPAGPRLDVTEPGLPMGLGRRHVLSRTIDEITEVFARMGFAVADGPEVEDPWHNFDALNIPA